MKEFQSFGDIWTVAKKAALEAHKEPEKRVLLNFNDIEMVVYSDSNPNDIADKYMILHQQRRRDAGYKD